MYDYTIVNYERDLRQWEAREAYCRDCATEALLAALAVLIAILDVSAVAELPI